MFHARVLSALGLVTLAVAAPAVAAAPSHAKFWENGGHTVVCGIKIHEPGKPATKLLCSAEGIPRAKHGIGDPFVQIGADGHAQLVLISQDSFEGNGSPATLGRGAVWKSLGVTCTVGTKTVRCKNRSSHGFKIGNGRYKSF